MTQTDIAESAAASALDVGTDVEAAVETVGRYRVEDLIALGGTATVHRAHDLRLGRDVALKRPRTGQGQAQHRLRLLDEGRLLAHLSHPGLVRVLDAAWEGPGAPYLALELVDGPDLDATLALRRLSPREAAVVGRDLASALAYLHSEGLVHRDVKPANVLLDSSGHARLCDLGVTLEAGEPDPHGRPGHTVGSIAYLAPEQVRGEDVTGAADTYALGLVLLEALTGRRAFPGSPTEAALARLQRDPEVPAGLPGGWAPLLTAMTAADPTDRVDVAEAADLLASGVPAPAAPEAAPGSGADGDRTALLTAPVATAPLATAPLATASSSSAAAAAPSTRPAADRAGDALARTPGRLLALWRGLAPHQRGVAGAVAGLVLLVVVAGLAAGSPGGTGPLPPTEPAGRTTQPEDGQDAPDGEDEGEVVSPVLTDPQLTTPGKSKGKKQKPEKQDDDGDDGGDDGGDDD